MLQYENVYVQSLFLDILIVFCNIEYTVTGYARRYKYTLSFYWFYVNVSRGRSSVSTWASGLG